MKTIAKRFIACLCVISMMFSMMVFAQASGMQITVDTKTFTQANEEETVEVPITLSGNTGILGMTLKVSYTEGLTLTKVEGGTALKSLTFTPPGKFEDNPFNLVWDGMSSADTTNGVIAILTFTVSKSTVKDYEINVSLDSGFDDALDPISVEGAKGLISIEEKPKENFTGVSLNSAEYTYEGNEKGLTVSGTVPSGANVSYTYNDSTAKPSDSGTYDVKAIVTKDGYNDLTLDAKMTIKPKNLTVSGLLAENKTYDGTTSAIISGGTLNGKVSGDDVSASFPSTGTFASADVGSNVAVSIANITLAGNDKDNYTLTQPAGLKANITKAPISIKANDVTIIKGAPIPTLSYTITSGQLFGSDKITGAPATAANGTKLGTFDITKGSLAVSSNYSLTFTKGKLTVVDKTPQNITVYDITEKTYGDSSFVVTATPDATSQLAEFTFESSNTDVAEIAADGTVTIKAAGKTNITVNQAGNETYAAFAKTQELVVKKAPITINADAKTKKIGASDPELTYQIVGQLVNGDSITGSLTRKSGEEIGQYDILIGTLAINNNYDITYNKAIFEIVDKTPQNIAVSDITEKTYGDSSFTVTATPDVTSQLTEFTFESSNTDVAEIAADGTVTIKTAGETDIKVMQAGNNEYAAFEKTQKLVVNKKAITVTSINGDEKTSVLEGVLAEDTAVTLDYDKLNIEVTEAASETTSNVIFTNFVLTGDKAANYTVTTESVAAIMSDENIVTITITADNGTATGAGKYIKGSKLSVTATPNSKYKFGGWYVNDTSVSSESTYSFTADADTVLVAKFSRRSSGGSGGGNSSVSYNVKFNTNGGNSIKTLSVKKNNAIAKPDSPVKNGFTFEGWYTDKELTKEYDFSTKVTKNITLYAKWSEYDVEKTQIILTIGDKSAKVFGESKNNDVAPKIVNDRTMLPARFVAESLGATVIWTETEPNKVMITKDTTEIIIYIGSDIAYVNSKEVKLDSPAFIENDRTYTPVRFISEELGADVEWILESQQVIITKK